MREAIENPVAFANSYGIDPKAFIELAPKVSQGVWLRRVLKR